MITSIRQALRGRGQTVGLAVAAIVVIAAGYFAFVGLTSTDEIQQTAYFTAAKGIYTGDDVRIQGVKVGTIDSVTPEGDKAKITYHYDAKYKVPTTADVALIAPSVVASRFIQLAWTDAQNHGPYFTSGAVIQDNRTAVPLEFDDVKAQLTKLSQALGPNGANSKGALTGLIETADKNLAGGNAELLHNTIKNLSALTDTLNNNKGDLFSTIKNLNSFIGNLNDNDVALTQFSKDLDGASGVLNNDRQELAVTLDSINQAFKTVSAFLKDNRSTIKQSTVSLAQLSQTINYSTKDIAEILHIAPTALTNFYNIYDPRYNALTGRFALTNFSQSPANLVCGLVLSLASAGTGADACKAALSPLVQLLGLSDGIPGLPGSNTTGTMPPAGKTKTATATPTTSPVQQTVGAVTGTVNGILGLLLPGGGK